MQVLRTMEEQLRSVLSALIVVDMTNDFCHPDGLAAKNRDLTPVNRIVPVIKILAEEARASGVPVFFILQTALPHDLSFSGPWVAVRERAPHSSPYVGLRGSWGQRVMAELEPSPLDYQIEKFRYSSFVGTRLSHWLRGRGIKTVVITGASTNVCVMATAMDAMELDFYPVIVEDAVASWNMALHEAALDTFRARYGLTAVSQDVIDMWNRDRGGRV